VSRLERTVETTGKTVEEAVEKAAARLGRPPEDLAVEVLDEGKAGWLGILGGREARVRAGLSGRGGSRRPEKGPARRPGPDGAVGVKNVVEDLLAAMEFEATVEAEPEGDGVQVRVSTEGMDGLLIGQKGQTLSALQHVVGRMVSRRLGRGVRVTVDVGGYLARRDELLRTKALRMAEEVQAARRERNFEPLPARERRIIHLALNDHPGVKTFTVGDGLLRRVVIAPSD
jgi:spoIIIJ-associated protein